MKNNSMKTFAKQFLQEIKNHQYIVIFHHQRPDGDCLGSQQALKLWIKKMFPKSCVNDVLNLSDKNEKSINEQQKEYAKSYQKYVNM